MSDRKQIHADTLTTEGTRVTIKYTETFMGSPQGLGVGYVLDGVTYGSPGGKDVAYEETSPHEVIYDGGDGYQKNYDFEVSGQTRGPAANGVY